MNRSNLKAWVLSGVSLLLAAYAFGLLYEGFIADKYSGLLTYPFVDRAAAQRAYQRLSPNAPVAERMVASYRLAEADPANPDSWNAVADAEYRKSGGVFTPKVLTALDHSYAVSFYDRTGVVWRICFALENWNALTPELRKDVMTEAGVALQQPNVAPELKSRLKAIRNPSGRLTAYLLMADPKAVPN